MIRKIRFNEYKFNIKKAYFVYVSTWFLIKPLLFFIFYTKYYKDKKVDELKSPFIIVSNHKSFIDPWLIGSGLSFKSKLFPIIWLAAEKFFKMPIISLIVKAYSSLPVKKILK
jgi:1-acyl-sn-glycerol-3-phosphate acyltransferase